MEVQTQPPATSSLSLPNLGLLEGRKLGHSHETEHVKRKEKYLFKELESSSFLNCLPSDKCWDDNDEPARTWSLSDIGLTVLLARQNTHN